MIDALELKRSILVSAIRGDGKPIFDIIDEQPTIEERKAEWIPCSERLPEVGAVLITDGNEIVIGYYHGDSTWSVDGCEYNPDLEKIAWMPLPEPYREEGEADDKT